MKKLVIALGLLCSVGLFSMVLFTAHQASTVKENVRAQNEQITHIEQFQRIGSWGEWFSEYVMVVKMDGNSYRIWTNAQGEITEKEDY